MFIVTHSKEKAALLFHILSAKLVLDSPAMPTCVSVVQTPPIRSCLSPAVGEAEGRKLMSDF